MRRKQRLLDAVTALADYFWANGAEPASGPIYLHVH